MELFRKAITGNQEILVRNFDVDSGLWTALEAREVLNEYQLENCKSAVS